ncbi:hypothetical protein J2Z76_002548 [Sedimentibacter acidaminivorans]|uniref:Sigma factor regulator C-terminal domain-containing protein n=1 Tax=Sedimentibacter acidaminivorans TaxID=913099 RepID=A0ABS4GGA4_9FIRM|nr:anti sigma factor C-terminal domain-containing protein [Sedimentibacter acidaminivorans]MBP1926679.1 hypothetical protein [Sedimentibacter acidaminivorans]
MTFRELLEKYKDGTLTEEKRLLVEQELEKSEAINDHLADELEKTIGLKKERHYETVEENNVDANGKMAREIKRTVNRRLAEVVGVSVACVIAIILFIQYIISPFVSSQYYDPTKKTSGQEYNQDLAYDLKAITEVSMPGYAMDFIYGAEDLGFGEYQLLYRRIDLFTKEEEIIDAKIKKNMRIGTYGKFYPRTYFVFRDFRNDEESDDDYESALEFIKKLTDEDIEHVRKLPQTSYISAWIRFSEDFNMKELYKIMDEYLNVDFKWIAVRTAEKQGQQLIGFLTGLNDGFDSDAIDEERYPGFHLVDTMMIIPSREPYEDSMAKRYEMHFLSLLQYLSDRKEATSALVGDTKNYDYKSALKYVEENGISTYGALVYGEANDLLELYESGLIMTFDIDNVSPSKFIRNIYNN